MTLLVVPAFYRHKAMQRAPNLLMDVLHGTLYIGQGTLSPCSLEHPLVAEHQDSIVIGNSATLMVPSFYRPKVMYGAPNFLMAPFPLAKRPFPSVVLSIPR